MIGLIVTLMLFVGVPLLFGARSRIGRLEHRLRLVEEELRRRIAAGQEILRDEAAPVAAPAVVSAPTPEPVPETAFVPEQEPEPEPEPEPVEVPEPAEVAEPAMAFAAPAGPAIQSPEPGPLPAEDTETRFGDEPVPASAPPRRAFDFEELFGRRLPIWAGGITLAIAGVLIVKYAIDAGIFGRIFTPGVQAVCGMVFGFGLIGGAEWAHRKRDKVDDPRVSQALSGAGISTLYAALLVAANVYGLISPLVAFIGLAAVTAGALWLSLRHGMPSALLGLAGGLAAPALTVGLDANVSMLAVYLTFTIAGLVGVSRVRRWPWLAALALAGGAGWSLWLILAGQALTWLGALSVGTFVILLAIALPLFAFKGAAETLLRTVSAGIGAAQLALLVATGGYQPLHWGLFALIAAAGQWLAWRNRDFAIVPTLGAALSVLLLLLWPAPSPGWLALIGLSLAAIHALPLLVRLWREPVRLQWALELSAIAVAIPVVTLRHFHAPFGLLDELGAWAAAGGALLALTGAALGWKVAGREEDNRFALLVATGSALLSLAAWFGFPHWQAPLWIGAIAAALLLLARPARDFRIELVAAAFSGLALYVLLATMGEGRWSELQVLVGWPRIVTDTPSLLRWGGLALVVALFGWRGTRSFVRQPAWFWSAALTYGLAAQLVPIWTLPLALAAIAAALLFALQRREPALADTQVLVWTGAAIFLLAITGDDPSAQWQRLSGAGEGTLDGLALLRWAGVAALAGLLAVRARPALVRSAGEGLAALLGYGAAAQVVPVVALPLVPSAAVLGLALWSRRLADPAVFAPRPGVAIALLAGVSAVWAAVPLAEWLAAATLSLGGVPMALGSADLAPLAVLRRLLAPALLLGGGFWALRERLSGPALLLGGGVLGGICLIAVHSLYRAGFAATFGGDFVACGLAQRLLWDLLLLGSALALWRRGGMLASHAAPAVVGVTALHLGWYSLVLHNPLWSDQAVGPWPLANLLLPLFSALPVCLVLVTRMREDWARWLISALQGAAMVMIALLGWATLRHAFHGTLLTAPGLPQLEDILRSLLGIALAVGYLLWGIRTKRRSWRIASLVLMLAAVAKVFLFDASGLEGLLRIASFVALGFSLIGIGWLYSRQLKSESN